MFTIIFYSLFLLYAGRKSQLLFFKQDAMISETIEEAALTEEDFIDINEKSQKIAFLVTDFFSNLEKSDPNYVFWEVNLVESDGNMEEITIPIEVHKCNETDWK